MPKKFLFLIFLFLNFLFFNNNNFFNSQCHAAELVSMNNGRAVMAAYQKAYAMNFEIYKPSGLPSGWYATFDGFPVAQVSENKWVYGQLGLDGAVIPTDILVGSVIPMNVPGLVRVAATENYGVRTDYVNKAAFKKILDYNCNRMGYLNDPYIRTVAAWRSHSPIVYIWLGERWKRISPNIGEYTWQALKRNGTWIHEQLMINNALLPAGDHFEIADLARQWGILWLGEVKLESLNYINRGNGGRDRDTSSTGVSEESSSETETPESGQEDNSQGNWDAGQ